MPIDLRVVNRAMRRGAIAWLVGMGLTIVGLGIFYGPRFLGPSADVFSVAVLLFIAAVMLIHIRGAVRTLGTTVTTTGLTRRALGEDLSISWGEVVRVRLRSGRIVLEREGSPHVVVSLMYVTAPDAVREAIFACLPTAAVRGSDASPI